jgi:hypothetical protein
LNGAVTDVLPHRLATPVEKFEITLQYIGSSIPIDVVAVLFPATVMNPPSHTRSDYLFGVYWAGTLAAYPSPGEKLPIILEEQHGPLNGDQSLIEGLTLFAPDEPSLSLPVTKPFIFARLTLSYLDASGRKLDLAYDVEAIEQKGGFKQDWRFAAEPKEVAKSLRELADEAKHGSTAQS